jgi:DNA adenine methylase
LRQPRSPRVGLEVKIWKTPAVTAGDSVCVDPLLPAQHFEFHFLRTRISGSKTKELRRLFAEAARRGVRLMLSSSNTDLIEKLYKDFRIHYVQARRAINCQGDKRGAISEILVLSYEIAK